jgi:hypothetical protein
MVRSLILNMQSPNPTAHQLRLNPKWAASLVQ